MTQDIPVKNGNRLTLPSLLLVAAIGAGGGGATVWTVDRGVEARLARLEAFQEAGGRFTAEQAREQLDRIRMLEAALIQLRQKVSELRLENARQHGD